MVPDNEAGKSTAHAGKRLLSCSTVLFSRLAHRKDITLLQIEYHERNELKPNALHVFQLIAIGIGCTVGSRKSSMLVEHESASSRDRYLRLERTGSRTLHRPVCDYLLHHAHPRVRLHVYIRRSVIDVTASPQVI